MSIGPSPGETYKLQCMDNDATGVTLANDDGVSMVLNGPNVNAGYYEVGKSYIFHVRPVDGYKPDGGAAKKPAR